MANFNGTFPSWYWNSGSSNRPDSLKYTAITQGTTYTTTSGPTATELKFYNTYDEPKSSKPKLMGLVKKFTELFLSEPEKSFRKAGITNGDGMLAQEGWEIFGAWLLKKHGAEFKAEVVDPILVEQEKEKK